MSERFGSENARPIFEAGSRRSFLLNRLLAALPDESLALIKAQLEYTSFRAGQLFGRDELKSHTFFVESGVLSILSGPLEDGGIEVAMVGPEGMASVAAVLGCPESGSSVLALRPVTAWRLPVSVLAAAMEADAPIRSSLLRYAQYVFVQLAETARAGVQLTIPSRLARWLLMVDDRIAAPGGLALTHEAVAGLLGVRRPGVTVAFQMLEGNGLIRAGRKHVIIKDRDGLKIAAIGSYGVAEAEYRRLFPSRSDELAR